LQSEPADHHAVNSGSTGAMSVKLELTAGLYVTGETSKSAIKAVCGAADAYLQAGAGFLIVGGAASADQLSSPGFAVYGGPGTATKAAGVGVIIGGGVKDADGEAAPGM